ncbi:MAG: RNA-binding protein [Patescibacteria group bacterium]|jgi:RNA recognition motif-containing protein
MQEEANNKLFVGNLPYSVNEEQLSELFSAVEGVTVVKTTIINDRETGRPRGFGFVEVENQEMAQKAIDAMNNKEIDGRSIIVNISRPQTERNDRFRGGNRNFQSGR